MSAIITNEIRIHNAAQFIEALGEPANTAIYTFISQPSSVGFGASPDNVQIKYNIWDNMISLKRVIEGDTKLVIPRYNWETGQTYIRYDHDIQNLEDARFFVVNNDYEVFKCLGNNGGTASTVEPSKEVASTTGSTSLLSDGYRWKYMYTITASDYAKFGTSGFIPTGTDSTTVSAAIDGGILHIEVIDGGNDYVSAPTITIQGDGSGAAAVANLSGNSIANVTISNPGSGYRYANVAITGNALLKATISPKGGHGADPAYELGAKYVMINTRLEPTDTDIPLDIQYNQIGLIADPLVYGTSNVAYGYSFTGYKKLTLSASAAGLTQGQVLTSNIGSNISVLLGDATGNVIYTQTNTTSANILANFKPVQVGHTFAGLGTVTAVINPEIQPDTGKILYIDNRNTISRYSDQVESIHIVLEF